MFPCRGLGQRVRRALGDRRRHQRYDIDGDLLGSLSSACLLEISNLSTDGALVRTFAPLPVHSVHEARLALSAEECDVRFEVCHIARAESGVPGYVMGVRFLDLAPRTLAMIEALMVAEDGGEAAQA